MGMAAGSSCVHQSVKHLSKSFFKQLIGRSSHQISFDIRIENMKVELEKVLSVSGKPGLFRVLNGGKSTVIAESLIDGKRHPILPTQRVSALSDISIFTVNEDKPLREVLVLMREKYSGEGAPDYKSDSKTLREAMKAVLPDYDAERVYDSDIRKLFQWYNLLQGKGLLDFAEPVAEDEEDVQAGE
jgi:hypothetical protein